MLPDKVFGVVWFLAAGVAIFAAYEGFALLAGTIAMAVLIYLAMLEVRYSAILAREGERTLARIQGGGQLAELRRREIAAVVHAVSLSEESKKAYGDFLARKHSLLAGKQERSDLHWPSIS